MNEDNKFWLLIWFMITVVIISLFILIYALANESNKAYYEARKNCIDSGGSWIVTTNNNAVCLTVTLRPEK